MKKSDSHWEKFGQEDPYYWVTTQNKYHKEEINSEKLNTFFSEGREYRDKLFNVIKKHVAADFAPQRCLDFGCGVGRILLPLAEISSSAVGLDVARTMLDKAELHCREAGLDNVTIAQSDDALSALEGSFDFIHSIYVFQHIPCQRGYKVFRQLLEKLNPGGVAMIQITYSNDLSQYRRIMNWSKENIPLFSQAVNLLHLRAPNTPMMEMHNYSLNHLHRIVHEFNGEQCYARYTQDGPFRGIMLFIQLADPDRDFTDLSPIP